MCAADLYKSNHPLVLCTDDAGVFSTSLSAEYALASSTFGRFHYSVDVNLNKKHDILATLLS